jgi:hypothetical protein
MGLKSTPQMPPPVDTSITDKTAEAEAKLEAEKQKAMKVGRKGMYGTILTSSKGVEDEATTGKTLLGGTIS